jgi:uncharacterized protein (DUF433 family)
MGWRVMAAISSVEAAKIFDVFLWATISMSCSYDEVVVKSDRVIRDLIVLREILQAGRGIVWARRYLSMSLVETRYEHVILDEAQVPIIAGTNMKVVELVLERTAYGWSPEELHFQHPYLTLGQIHSALAYYWDHQEELDRDIERRLEFVDRVQRAMGPSPLVARLKAKRLI